MKPTLKTVLIVAVCFIAATLLTGLSLILAYYAAKQ